MNFCECWRTEVSLRQGTDPGQSVVPSRTGTSCASVSSSVSVVPIKGPQTQSVVGMWKSLLCFQSQEQYSDTGKLGLKPVQRMWHLSALSPLVAVLGLGAIGTVFLPWLQVLLKTAVQQFTTSSQSVHSKSKKTSPVCSLFPV